MRKRKYVIAATLALAASVAVAAIAQATIGQQNLIVSVAAKKQDKKVKGPADINITVDTPFTAPQNPAQTDQNTNVDIDRDFTIVPGKVPTCNATSLAGTTTDQANATCGPAKIGSGAATLCSSAAGCAGTPGGGVQGVVTAFNGQPSGGSPAVILHARFGPPANTTTVLTGTFQPSPLGAPYGQRLVVLVPDTSLTGLRLTHFQTSISKLVSVKANKKKHKPAKFYVMAKCSHKVWSFRSETNFRAGGGQGNATTTVPCTQKKTKKKK
jgi:hypothetical protein